MVSVKDFIEEYLLGSFWHTTSSARFERIIQSGFIMADPPLPEAERYGGMPFVRSLGGVSIFDFPSNFSFEKYEAELPGNSIGEFIPFKRLWGSSIWLRINTDMVSNALKSGREIRDLWRKMGSTRRFMAQVEGAHIGDIPLAAVQDAFEIGVDVPDMICLNHLLTPPGDSSRKNVQPV
ncbi:hypothetical protein JMM63_04460 [Rhodovulum sulfidophilum]|uniref:hypothetical protein n=1 Tax=Rhodovulum sulfidophilum TaxID=35806 RepID=UPI001924EFC3|nr:hypothetical protein [Rhodovulum sulfidophilum]MBL3594827.1 hypothetical protein [Rhodovulum sulfidophilum]